MKSVISWVIAVPLFVATVPFAAAGFVARVLYETFRKGWDAAGPR